MRTFIFLLCSTAFGFTSSEIFSQNTKIQISKNQIVSIDAVFDLLRDQTEYTFIYQEDLFKDTPKVELRKGTIRANKLLETCFLDKNFKLDIKGNKIVITKSDTSIIAKQTTTVSGAVSDSDGRPLPGANIVEKGTTNGVTADFDGNFVLDISNDNAVLVISYIGFATKEVRVNGQSIISISLAEDAAGLDEVVLIGYGGVKRSDLTGSVASITSEDIEEIPTNTVSNLLQGRAAGVQVTTGDGAPGGGINIRIRGTSTITGSTEPLYIVDGFPVNSDNNDLYVGGGINEGSVEGAAATKVRPNALSMINPNDIANIEILKDAAATAIYGSRGANGVVLITTKRGKAGKTQVNINYSTGVNTIIRKLKRLDGPAYINRVTEAEINGGVHPDNVRFNGSDSFHPLAQNAGTYDWQDLIYRPAVVQNLAVSFTGGNENTKFLLSGKYYDEEGIMITSGFKDAQVRLNLDQKVGSFLNLKTSLLLSHSVEKRVPTGSGFNFNAVTAALGYSPAHNPEWFEERTGLWYTDTKASNPDTNPLKILEDVESPINTNRVLGNVQADFHLTKSLTFTASAGLDYSDAVRKTYVKRTLTFFGSPVPQGSADINHLEAIRTNGNGYFSWSNTFGSHNLDAVGGVELISQTISNLNLGIDDFATDELGTDNLAGGNSETINLSNGKRKWQTVGFFGRLNYNYKSKYYASLNVRQDGSSVFGEANKWAFFPSLALAWRPSEEAFMQNQDLVSNLKIRASVGQTGNGALDPYSSIGLWGISGNAYSYDNQIVNGVRLSRISNPDLKWETTTQYNLGLDARFFNSRIGFTFDYFLKDTDDLILPVVIPRSTGFGSSIQNLGSLRNSGVEFGVDAVVVSNENFTWNLNANLSRIRAKATEVGEGTAVDPNTGEPYIEVAQWPRRGGPRLYKGQPAGQIYGYVIEGIFRDQAQADSWPVDMDPQRNLHKEGFYIYKDINNDGIITDADRESLGTGQPDYVFGFTNRFNYKNFDLSLFFQGVTGTDIVMFYGGDSDKPEASDNWTPNNRDAFSAINSTANNSRKGLTFDNRQVQDGSYLRLKNVRLGYTLPKAIGVFSGINIYLNASNVFTLTTYDGYNPDVSSGGSFAFGEGFDAGVYPLSKSYTLGLNFNF
ncbi:TonB-linked outer membrane protein, SusC/RagA family [Kriegella aquimaris]|uniref:TonB-linked outer membrane protein, SusC/RagA family n=2 Tax=Kriegella aquimaris TaxID=192904 RepID=A0A1G9XUW9_9FLAO|nr:TonB-linked outer membrane protein, SusC/RagA family [Kriegella aquimaris]